MDHNPIAPVSFEEIKTHTQRKTHKRTNGKLPSVRQGNNLGNTLISGLQNCKERSSRQSPSGWYFVRGALAQ